jgi:hypothetical protein
MLDHETYLRCERGMMVTNTVKENLDVIQDIIIKSNPLVGRRKKLFDCPVRGNTEKKSDYIMAVMLSANKAEVNKMTGEDFLVYLTLGKLSDFALMEKWYKIAQDQEDELAPGQFARPGTMEELLKLAKKQEALEATTGAQWGCKQKDCGAVTKAVKETPKVSTKKSFYP